MNAKMLFKLVFLIAVAVVLVLMGMNNKDTVKLRLPPLLRQPWEQPAAMMYIAFFGVGLLSGAVLVAGGGGKGGAGKSGGSKNKVEK